MAKLQMMNEHPKQKIIIERKRKFMMLSVLPAKDEKKREMIVDMRKKPMIATAIGSSGRGKILTK
jgi:hypothetical protein